MAELGLHQPVRSARPLTVNVMARTFYGFHQMLEHKVSAMAVVDDAGVLQGNLSMSDLCGLAADLGSLLLPVHRFLRERVPQDVPVMCSSSTTFGTAIDRLVDHGMHRLWCTDAMQRPVAAVTLTDMLRVIDQQALGLHEAHLRAAETTICKACSIWGRTFTLCLSVHDRGPKLFYEI